MVSHPRCSPMFYDMYYIISVTSKKKICYEYFLHHICKMKKKYYSAPYDLLEYPIISLLSIIKYEWSVLCILASQNWEYVDGNIVDKYRYVLIQKKKSININFEETKF